MIDMKAITWLLLLALGLIQACTGEQAPTPAEQQRMESVSLVLYYSDGDFDVKTTGETALLNTGELVTVQRKVIRPSGAMLTGDWNGRFLEVANAPPSEWSMVVTMDRAEGRLCK